MNIADLNLMKSFSFLSSDKIALALQTKVDQALQKRRIHERKWYENQWFDDGYHFRIMSRKTGRIIDKANTNAGNTERAIPRASRQIRGVTNLLFAAEPYPVVYPERITKQMFVDNTGNFNEEVYTQAKQQAKRKAQLKGNWLSTEWIEEQGLDVKLINMILKASKTSVAYLQVYSDTDKQKICTDVYDGFDIVLDGEKENLEDCPFIDKVRSRSIPEILADPLYQKADLRKLSPDNRYAASEIKEAYMRSRYGSKSGAKEEATALEHETFVKEYLSDDNWRRAVKLGGDTGAMEGKSKGDMIMRHTFWAAGVSLHDEYVNYDCYPFAEYRFEPGPLYQKPYIENFVPQNKSLDIIMTRLERWVNAMVIGVIAKRKNENYQISNAMGAQFVEYEGTPPIFQTPPSVGSTPFNVISLLDKYIEEQGASTSALNSLPQGVKSGVAIESVKATEYANLKIPTLMLKQTIKKIADLMLERADKDYLEPQETSYIEDGEPEYFDVIGERGYEMSQKLGVQLPEDVVVLSKKTRLRVEIEPGMGLTMQGKREAMQQIITFMIQLAETGAIPRGALNMVIKKFLETFGYGNTQEFMDEIEEGLTEADIDDAQVEKIKLAVVEAMKDAGAVGPEAEQKQVDTTKLGVVEAMKDLGMANIKQEKQPERNKVSISYKDLPPEGQVQAAAQAGIQVNPQSVVKKEAMQNKPMQKPIANN